MRYFAAIAAAVLKASGDKGVNCALGGSVQSVAQKDGPVGGPGRRRRLLQELENKPARLSPVFMGSPAVFQGGKHSHLTSALGVKGKEQPVGAAGPGVLENETRAHFRAHTLSHLPSGGFFIVHVKTAPVSVK